MQSVGIVGCAHIHTPGFVDRLTQRDEITVTAVYDRDPKRSEPHATTLEAQQVEDVNAIWEDDDIQAVVICSETDRHEPLVTAACDHGKHLFVEKPLGMGARDAYRMAETIEQAGVLFQTGYFMRSQPVNRFMRQQIAAGAFGKITRIRGSNCHSGSLRGLFDSEWRWMADPAIAGCGAFGDLGTHALDIMLWLMGNPDRVTAHIDIATGRYPDCDEYGEGLLHFSNGSVGTLAAGWVDLANPVSLQISGTEGHAIVIDGELFFQSRHVEGADGNSPWQDLPDALPHAFNLFLDALETRDPAHLVTAREAAVRSAVMEAMYESAAANTWESPHYPGTKDT